LVSNRGITLIKAGGEGTAAEIYQAQVIKNFFDTITGTDRNLTRIYMCVMSLAKLRMESPEKMAHLLDQVRKSKIKKELSVDILDYVCDVAVQLEMNAIQTAFGIKDIRELAQDFSGISVDSL
jgi:hypothetical protein